MTTNYFSHNMDYIFMHKLFNAFIGLINEKYHIGQVFRWRQATTKQSRTPIWVKDSTRNVSGGSLAK